MTENQKKLRIGFIHPDMGIGGAEQLVVNLAVALKNKGHNVIIYTPHHDPKHCFQETINGTIPVEVAGRAFPRTIFGRCIAFCALVRMWLCTLYLICFGFYFDLIIVDQVSVVVPLLRFFNRRCLFYCHFPDKLLCVDRKSTIKKIYRFFLDWIEELSLLFANDILVNSKFTKSIFQSSFTFLSKYKSPQVLYPAIDFSQFEASTEQTPPTPIAYPFFLSLNRYERKKNIDLAIKSFALFLKDSPSKNQNIQLIIAGGYDERISENTEHHKELASLAEKLGVKDQVVFKFSISNSERQYLLSKTLALLYTPENEHFGIVPVEGMYMSRPILASKSGGPMESILDKETGFLLSSDEKEWAKILSWIVNNPKDASEMGTKGKKRAIDTFGLAAFGNQLENTIKEICIKNYKQKSI